MKECEGCYELIDDDNDDDATVVQKSRETIRLTVVFDWYYCYLKKTSN